MQLVTTIRVPDELMVKVKAIAKKKGIPVNALIVQMLWELV